MKTLPPLKTRNRSVNASQQCLRLTIVFHPNLARIGAYSDLLSWPDCVPPDFREVMVIGRHSPCFSDGESLAELHVSRAALEISSAHHIPDPPALMLTLRVPEHSECLLGPKEQRELVADPEMLARGVAIRMGHGVVMLLRSITVDVSELSTSNALHGKTLFKGASIEAARINRQIAAVAATDLPVMILGESGVGKELVARSVHQLSHRASNPLVSVNMGAIPEALAPAELFGAVKGAYTGAEPRSGYFLDADQGTLFLDEIGDTPEAIQVQLLRALEQGDIQVVGGKPRNVDVRVIAATDAAIGQGQGFRHALHTRLAGFTINVPPLRSRLEDIGPQALSMLRQQPRPHPRFPLEQCAEVENVSAHWGRVFFDLLNREWTGNSRELSRVVARANHDDPEVAPSRERVAVQLPHRESDCDHAAGVTDEQIYAAYEAAEFEVKGAANLVGLSRTSMYRRVEQHPDCLLVGDLSDKQIRDAMADETDLQVLGRTLRVSARALRARVVRLRADYPR